jgi:hypothetical protein
MINLTCMTYFCIWLGLWLRQFFSSDSDSTTRKDTRSVWTHCRILFGAPIGFERTCITKNDQCYTGCRQRGSDQARRINSTISYESEQIPVKILMNSILNVSCRFNLDFSFLHIYLIFLWNNLFNTYSFL